jgi:fructokinase
MIVCMGELLIDFVASEHGVTVGEANAFIKAPGGAPANVAVAVRRLGMASAFMGQVGDDPFGHALAKVLSDEGVDVSALTFSTQARTALAFVALAANGERSFSFYRNPSADMLLRPEDLRLAVLDGARAFHFGSISLIDEPSRSATLHALKAAQARGLWISYDPNLRLALWPSAQAAREGMLLAFPEADMIKISEEELEFLSGGHDDAAARSLWHERTQLLLVTRGNQGCTAYTADKRIDVGGFAVNTIDTTGAGDSFVAAVLVGLLERDGDLMDLANTLRFANAVGALTTTQKGAIPALATRAQVEAFLG